jgi:hypothetical protein
MEVTLVNSQKEKRLFHDLPKRLYRNDPDWICPLDDQTENIFNPSKNDRFRNGEAVRWILRDHTGKVIGRIAAFVDEKRSAASRQPTGGIGFFEVTDDKNAAFLLFDTAREWLSEKGMQAMDGPISFGENYNYWGLLVEGFTQQGYGMPYSKKYYQGFFEDYGFRNYFEQYSYHKLLRQKSNGEFIDFPERMLKVAEWVINKPGYTFRHFTSGESEKFIEDTCTIYNDTWQYLKQDFTAITREALRDSLHEIRFFLDEKMIWFAYFNEQPVGFFILVPDFNQILRHFNGRITVAGLPRVFWYKYTHEMTRLQALAGGVLHSFQKKGIESGIFYKIYESIRERPWLTELEIGWVGNYNPKMMATCDALGAVKAKTHVTYRYMINKSIEFMTFVEEKTQSAEHRSKSAE